MPTGEQERVVLLSESKSKLHSELQSVEVTCDSTVIQDFIVNESS